MYWKRYNLEYIDEHAYNKGWAHGMKHDHPYDPHYRWSRHDKELYAEGFNDGSMQKVDERHKK